MAARTIRIVAVVKAKNTTLFLIGAGDMLLSLYSVQNGSSPYMNTPNFYNMNGD